MKWLNDFISLAFPRICVCCGNALWKNEEILCRLCEYHLPMTHFHTEADNPVTRLFWGRVQVEYAASFLYFNKGSKVQRMIHQLKYKGRQDIGRYLGHQYGCELAETASYKQPELIIPVPLHQKKEKQRGYNQSELFALGLSEVMKIPVGKKLLVREKATATQTRKARFERFRNVNAVFKIPNPEALNGKHVLLVDDVITTGATLEACALLLTAIPGCKVSVASIAVARM